MNLRIAARRIREAIERATITLPGWPSVTFTLGQEEPKPESMLAKVAREGGRWWEKNDEQNQQRLET